MLEEIQELQVKERDLVTFNIAIARAPKPLSHGHG